MRPFGCYELLSYWAFLIQIWWIIAVLGGEAMTLTITKVDHRLNFYTFPAGQISELKKRGLMTWFQLWGKKYIFHLWQYCNLSRGEMGPRVNLVPRFKIKCWRHFFPASRTCLLMCTLANWPMFLPCRTTNKVKTTTMEIVPTRTKGMRWWIELCCEINQESGSFFGLSLAGCDQKIKSTKARLFLNLLWSLCFR